MARKRYVHPSQKAGTYTPTRGAFKGTTFASYRQYQNAHAKAKGFGSSTKRLAAPRRLTAADGFAALSHEPRVRAVEGLNFMRRGRSIGAAAREAETTVPTMWRYVGRLLRKGKGGRITAARSDNLAVVMPVPTSAGSTPMVVLGSRSRKLLSDWYNAVLVLRDFGVADFLEPFRGKSILTADGRIPLPIDPQLLTRLLKEGRLSIESLYAKGIA